MPPEGFQGVVHVLGTVDGLKRFVTIHESPYHGLNFCVGTVAEMLQDPTAMKSTTSCASSAARKIFNIHFRNIRGNRDDFCEMFPDDGDIDMLDVARTLHEVGLSLHADARSHAEPCRRSRRIASLRVRLRVYQGSIAGYRVHIAGSPLS